MLFLLFGLFGRRSSFASLGDFTDCRCFHWKVRDHRFVMAERYALLVSFCRAHSPDPHLLFEEQTALSDEYFFDNWDHDAVALLFDDRHRVNVLTNRNPEDLCRLMS